jgi:MFS family permease
MTGARQEPQRAPVSPWVPFRYPAFRAIWIANFASTTGSMIQAGGAAWLMTDLTRSHQLVALVQASTTIPILLLALFAGSIADNFDRRRVMLAAQTWMLVVSGLLALLAWRGLLDPLLLLAFTFAVGAGTALNAPAWQASVRLQVGHEHLPQAISLNTVAMNLARSVGPALGGLLISLTSPAMAFAFNSISYLAMIAVLLRWRPAQTQRPRQAMLPSIALGVRYCLTTSALRRVLLRGFIFGLGIASYQALIPVVVRDRIHGTEVDYGLALGTFGIGSILSALMVSNLRRRYGSEAVVSVATLLFAAAMVPLALAHSLLPVLGATLVAGGGWVATLNSLNVAMQLRAPEDLLGRCLSFYQALTFGGLAIGSYMVGLIADLVGLPTALLGAAAFLVVTLLLLRLFAPMPRRGEGHPWASNA